MWNPSGPPVLVCSHEEAAREMLARDRDESRRWRKSRLRSGSLPARKKPAWLEYLGTLRRPRPTTDRPTSSCETLRCTSAGEPRVPLRSRWTGEATPCTLFQRLTEPRPKGGVASGRLRRYAGFPASSRSEVTVRTGLGRVAEAHGANTPFKALGFACYDLRRRQGTAATGRRRPGHRVGRARKSATPCR
jgi:hypothetical protein